MDKINFGLKYTLTMKRGNSGNSIYRTIGDEAKVEIKDIVWYMRQDTPSFDDISLVNEHILSKRNTEYSYFLRMVSYKPISSNKNWGFEIGEESDFKQLHLCYSCISISSESWPRPNST